MITLQIKPDYLFQFCPSEPKKIHLSIINPGQDTWVWTPSSSGQFYFKTAHELLLSLTAGYPNALVPELWKKLYMEPKNSIYRLRQLAWRIAWNSLPES
jgi:hypothetical protein